MVILRQGPLHVVGLGLFMSRQHIYGVLIESTARFVATLIRPCNHSLSLALCRTPFAARLNHRGFMTKLLEVVVKVAIMIDRFRVNAALFFALLEKRTFVANRKV